MTSESLGMSSPAAKEDPILSPDYDLEGVSRQVSDIPFARKLPFTWWIGFAFSFLLLMMLLMSASYLFLKGVGVWGINIPVAWGFAIVNFVWWIGIGHAGTLISAILFLLHQEWRNSISRFAEATTLFAVACAGLFPLFHLGRVWRFYYILPYPNSMDLWPQWRSPLVWDVFAVMTYGTVSLLFWYVGLVPDLATMRDRAKSRFPRICFGILSLGWRNSARHWNSYQTAYLLLAGLATPLVVSVHSIVSLDFTVSIIPGWHSTIFPPYFVAGAIYSGFAMLLTLLIPLRAIYGLKGLITDRHLENMGKVLLVTGLLVGYGYVMEGFTTWYSDNEYEWYMTVNRYTGPYAVVVWSLMVCNVLAVQALWFKWCRRNVYVLFIVAMAVNVGMWIERYMIVVTSLHRDFLPSSWGMYAGTFWDWTLLFGSIGLFLTLTFVFVRLLPMISIFEMRELIAHKQHESSAHSEGEGASS